MKLKDTKPKLVKAEFGHAVLTLLCPACQQLVTLNLLLGGPADIEHQVWAWHQPAKNSAWSGITLDPAVPHCSRQFTILDGKITVL